MVADVVPGSRLSRAGSGGRHPEPDHVAPPDVFAFGGAGRGPYHVAAGVDRRLCELGLPLLLAAGCLHGAVGVREGRTTTRGSFIHALAPACQPPDPPSAPRSL